MMQPRWLLLAYQLPNRPSNARVKTWRRFQQLGAVAARNAGYVLPNTEECREDFEWMRAEIVALGGAATVFTADVLGPAGDDEMIAMFSRAREADYGDVKRDADRLARTSRGKSPRRSAARDRRSQSVRRLRDRLAAIERVDFFGAAGRQEAVEAVAALDRPTANAGGPRVPPVEQLPAADFQKRRWVTRPRPGVDRMASAWLIRRFIDPGASFAFSDHPGGADVPFDMYTGEFSHRGPLCTFEVLATRFGIADKAVEKIGRIVHDLDMKETRYAAPEAPAVARLIEGLRQLHPDDAVLLEHGIAMFEALARAFSSEDAGARRQRKPSRPKPRRRS